MTLVSLTDVTKRHADRMVLDGVSLGIARGDRVGVIGVNGSGKSTLLRLAAGPQATVTGGQARDIDEPDAGSVVHATGARVHLVPQEPQLDDDATPLAVALAADTPAASAARRFSDASTAARRSPDDPAVLAELESATAQMDARGGWEVESRARALLDRLGVAGVEEPIAGRSGGERKRVALAATLTEPPDVLILDEPTNHLDVDAVEWLQDRLRGWSGALLLVTHDRYLLDAVATRVVEVHQGRIHVHGGGYASYLEARELRRAQAEAEQQRATNRARAELAYLRQGAKARTSKSKQRVRQAQEAVAAASDGGPSDEQMRFELPVPRLGGKVVNLHGAGVQVPGIAGEKARWVLRNVDWRLQPDERMGVVGPNGSGKTTLLRLIAGEATPDAGSRRVGDTVRVGLYRQNPSGLPPRTRVRDVIEEEVRTTELTSGHRVSSGELLERFLFDAAHQRAYVAELSGGERRRLELLRVLASAPNVLLLDEPTNDLDLDTLAVLEEYLDGWPGALVVASHDRFMLDRVCGQVVAVEDAELRHYPSGWREWRARQRERSQPPTAAVRRGASAGASVSTDDGGQGSRRPRKRSYREERELADAETRMAQLGERREALNAELESVGDDHERAAELGRELAAANQELERLEERWLELSMIGEDS